MRIAITVLIVLSSAYVSAQAFDVKIIGRQDNETEYTYVVAGHLSSQSDSSANCNVNDYNVNCNGTTTTNADSTPAHQVSYRVRGATFSLQLPDGRVVVVNCESKFAEHFAGPAGNHRSCRKPLVGSVHAEFHGDKAKLEWVVSLDGKKKESETYKVLAAPAPTLLETTRKAMVDATMQLIAKGQASHCAVVTNPVGAEIYIDGEPALNEGKVLITPTEFVLKQQSNLCGERCPTRIVTIKMAGYKTVEKTIVPDGKDVSMAIFLEPAAAPVAPAITEPSLAEGAKIETVSAVQSQPTGGDSLGDAAKRMKQQKACLELAKDNPSIICK